MQKYLFGVEIDGEMTYKVLRLTKLLLLVILLVIHSKTSGPSMNILIKLTCLVGLVIAPILGDGHGESKKRGFCSDQC